MLTSFVLSMTLAAPVPAPAPVASGPAPKIMELKANAEGKITVLVTRTQAEKAAITTFAPNGFPITNFVDVQVPKAVAVELSDVKELKITTADGKRLETADAVKATKGGATVIISSDGKPVSPNYLKLFKDDVLVLTSPELADAGLGREPQGMQAVPAPVQLGQFRAVPVAPAQPAVPAKP